MSNQVLYLSQEDVANVGLSMPDIINAVEKGFVEMGNDRVEMHR